jgi:hypothetical protein
MIKVALTNKGNNSLEKLFGRPRHAHKYWMEDRWNFKRS